jgi:hypothetical protein
MAKACAAMERSLLPIGWPAFLRQSRKWAAGSEKITHRAALAPQNSLLVALAVALR